MRDEPNSKPLLMMGPVPTRRTSGIAISQPPTSATITGTNSPAPVVESLYGADGAGSRRLADAPEQGQWRLHDAADILAPSMMQHYHS